MTLNTFSNFSEWSVPNLKWFRELKRIGNLFRFHIMYETFLGSVLQLFFSVHIFVDNRLKNINRSSNNYHFDPVVNKFASVFNILAGHHAYEYFRVNFPGSLPSITILKNYNRNSLNLKEGEFRFDFLTLWLRITHIWYLKFCRYYRHYNII